MEHGGTIDAPRVASASHQAPVLVRRQHALGVVRAAAAPLICISAPSGYGKTTLINQWSVEDERRFVAVHAGAPFSSAPVVAERVVTMLKQAQLVPDHATLPASEDALGWHVALLPALSALVAGVSEPVVLVIDDATDVEGAPWTSLLDCLVDSLPPGSSLCLATRTGSPRPIRLRRATDAVLEIGIETLAFNAVETAELLDRLSVSLSDNDLLEFLDRTEGWPALTYLGGLAVQKGTLPAALPSAYIGVFRDFIRDSIFDHLDPRTRSFLLRSSVLSELNAPLCTALTGEDGSLALLRSLSSKYSLVVPMDATETRFRLHHLLADFLNDELRATSIADWHQAHAAASRSLEDAADLDGAIDHARLAADDDRLAQLVWEHAPVLIGSGRSVVVRRWLESIETERIHQSPRLAVVAAWVAQHAGDVASMAHFHAVAERVCEQRGCDDLRPHVDLLGASLARDGVAEMERTASACVRSLPVADHWLAAAYLHSGMALTLLGRYEEAAEDLRHGRDLARAHRLSLVESVTLSTMVMRSVLVDEHARALRELGDLRDILTRSSLQASPVAAPAYCVSAYGYLLEGRPDEARAHVELALRLTSLIRGVVPWYSVEAPLLLAQVLLGLGDVRRASTLLAEAEAEYSPASSCPVNDTLLSETRDSIAAAGALDTSPEALTLAETRVLQYLPTHMTFPEVAAELFVSRYTVKTQALAVYRKLGVHSRGAAVDRARLMGLLPRI